MLGKHEGNGCLGKQLLNVGSRAVMKMSHLHSHQASSSGENLSPRSVLEQCAVSGLAVALDLHNNNYSPTQENVVICRFLSKERLHHILLMNSKDLRTTSDGSFMMGRHLSKQMLDYLPADEEEVVPPNSNVGLRVVDSLHIYGEDGDDGSEYISPHRPQSVKLSSYNSPSMHSMMNFANPCRSFPPRKGSWFHQGDGKVSASSFVEGSIFSYPSYTSCNMSDDGDDDLAGPLIREDFLKLCSFCKCQLNMGKDIYMYRGDQAFCSAECRYQQIVEDEGKGSSSLSRGA